MRETVDLSGIDATIMSCPPLNFEKLKGSL